MYSPALLKTKINKFSVIGSLLYGLWCGLMAAQDMYGSLIGRVFCFLCGALFFFALYVFFSENRDLVARLRKHKFKYIALFIVCWAILCNGACLVYMYVYNVPSEVAIEKVACVARDIFCYTPFLP